MHQLQHLRVLNIWGIEVVSVGNTAASALAHTTTASNSSAPSPAADRTAAAVLGPALAGLTELMWSRCRMSLAGLDALIGLPDLLVAHSAGQDGLEPAGTLDVLAHALPQLQQLTSLHLMSGAVRNTVLMGIDSCTGLLSLQLTSGCCSAAGLQQLPCSLTSLNLDCSTLGDASAPRLALGPHSTPRISQLSALQSLLVFGVPEFNTAVLEGLSSLTSLYVRTQRSTAIPGQYRFQALAEQKLPRLQDVDLNSLDLVTWSSVIWTEREAAALTAAATLTSLTIQGSLFRLSRPAYCAMFPAGRVLPSLQHLAVGVGLLECTDAVQQMARCCPEVTSLSFIAGGNAHAVDDTAVAASLSALQGGAKLQQLRIDDMRMRFSAACYRALAGLPAIANLSLTLAHNYSLDKLLLLESCHTLRDLSVRCCVFDDADIATFFQAVRMAEVSGVGLACSYMPSTSSGPSNMCSCGHCCAMLVDDCRAGGCINSHP